MLHSFSINSFTILLYRTMTTSPITSYLFFKSTAQCESTQNMCKFVRICLIQFGLFGSVWYSSLWGKCQMSLGFVAAAKPTVRSPRRTNRNIPGICFKLPAVALFVLMFVEVEMRKVFGQSKEQKLVEKYALSESWVRGVWRKGVGGSKGKSDGVYFIFVATVQDEVVGKARRVVKCSLVSKASFAYF